jgi:hypothetical protein
MALPSVPATDITQCSVSSSLVAAVG